MTNDDCHRGNVRDDVVTQEMRRMVWRSMLAGMTAVCVTACVPSGPPGGRMARFSPTDRDPVGFLLLNRDSLALPDSMVQRLVQLNLRLFRRNQPLQNQIDSMMRDVKFSRRREPGDSSAIPADIRDAARPLAMQIRSQTAAVKDTAWSWLSPDQKERADSLEARQIQRMNRGQPATVGAGEGRP
jgi:hypothetical protein